MNGQRDAGVRDALYARSSYRPFALGLEQGYASYDDFVRDFTPTVAPLKFIDEKAQARSTQRAALIERMKAAYLDRNFAMLADLNPGYPLYMERIAREFSDSSTARRYASSINISGLPVSVEWIEPDSQ